MDRCQCQFTTNKQTNSQIHKFTFSHSYFIITGENPLTRPDSDPLNDTLTVLTARNNLLTDRRHLTFSSCLHPGASRTSRTSRRTSVMGKITAANTACTQSCCSPRRTHTLIVLRTPRTHRPPQAVLVPLQALCQYLPPSSVSIDILFMDFDTR